MGLFCVMMNYMGVLRVGLHGKETHLYVSIFLFFIKDLVWSKE
nr:MAG TPA: hypothetical protein [Caudoviricetes sp.]